MAQIDPERALEFNKEILKPLKNHFGSVGEVLYEGLTSPNALGNEISKSSAIIDERLGTEQYKNSLNSLLNTADNIDFSGRLSPLLEKVKDLTDKNGNTLQEALDIIKNVFQDPSTVEELRNRIAAPIVA